MNKKQIITSIIIVLILFISLLTIFQSKPTPAEKLVKCIGEKATLYITTGIPACKTQTSIFEKYIKYIPVIDCIDDVKACKKAGIERAPTWIINNIKYEKFLSIEDLMQLTGCKFEK